ncbi:Isopentenyl phosphate kinase enzyme of modified mevalonate pathway [Methanonatronarchaeum thermophilum]|uniref:Isopentenyl phosphate kinase n=1 Tax=Methanonatronarchaeum thermophilum TaxID=1927129 RepID=A0A1Y3GF96_9EURY|nr:isopentenyl phosphate kinase [Methanonatronarchaeum thermophilum]OUJ18973.1 Isopentenyl phosphate kinase enzyme of modified mevalonate pathway [Methanonatronarchaeum thermophilum]
MKLLKIGGSIITNKDRYKSINKKNVKRIANEISEFPNGLVLVHGAGSYGHPIVKKHGLNKIGEDRFVGGWNERLIAFEEVRRSVKELNSFFVNTLNDKGVPTTTIHPSSFVITEKSDIKEFQLETLELAYQQKSVPILHGDMVMDTEYGGAVLSGDKIISFIAKNSKIEVDRVGMATNTPVINDKGEKIMYFREKHKKYLNESDSIDVTGGMKNKVQELIELKKPAYIFDATKPGAILDFLKGRKVGTEIK